MVNNRETVPPVVATVANNKIERKRLRQNQKEEYMNCKRKKQERAGGRRDEKKNKANCMVGVFSGSQPREDSLRQGGAEAAENEKGILVNNGETGPPVVAREIGAFPVVSVQERSITNYVDLTSSNETAGKNKVATKRLRQT